MPKLSIKIVEVDKSKVSPLSAEQAAPFVARLKDDPGFQWLLSHLEVQRGGLRAALETNRHKSERDFEFVQSGIAWCGWLQQQVEKAVGIVNRPVPRVAKPHEMEAFEQLRNNVEFVGVRNEGDNAFADGSPQG